ncbi:Myosin-M heavy chain (RhoGEF domain-containing protein myoM), partial [Durusdinium trenchii]
APDAADSRQQLHAHVLHKSRSMGELNPQAVLGRQAPSEQLERQTRGPRLSIDMPDDKDERTQLLEEILASERSYVDSLCVLVTHFVQPLERLSKEGDPVVSDKVTQSIFSNVSQLMSLNVELLRVIEMELKTATMGAQGGESEGQGGASGGHDDVGNRDGGVGVSSTAGDDSLTGAITKAFKELVPYFKMYSWYVNNYPTAVETLKSEQSNNKRFAKFLAEQHAHEICRGLDVGAYLIMPVQRLCKYPLLFARLLKETDSSNPGYETIQEVTRVVNEITGMVDLDRDRAEKSLRGFEIANFVSLESLGKRMGGDRKLHLLQPGRVFKHEWTGALARSSGKRSNADQKTRTMFLFSNVLIIAKKGSKGYDAKVWMDLDSIQLGDLGPVFNVPQSSSSPSTPVGSPSQGASSSGKTSSLWTSKLKSGKRASLTGSPSAAAAAAAKADAEQQSQQQIFQFPVMHETALAASRLSSLTRTKSRKSICETFTFYFKTDADRRATHEQIAEALRGLHDCASSRPQSAQSQPVNAGTLPSEEGVGLATEQIMPMAGATRMANTRSHSVTERPTTAMVDTSVAKEIGQRRPPAPTSAVRQRPAAPTKPTPLPGGTASDALNLPVPPEPVFHSILATPSNTGPTQNQPINIVKSRPVVVHERPATQPNAPIPSVIASEDEYRSRSSTNESNSPPRLMAKWFGGDQSDDDHHNNGSGLRLFVAAAAQLQDAVAMARCGEDEEVARLPPLLHDLELEAGLRGADGGAKNGRRAAGQERGAIAVVRRRKVKTKRRRGSSAGGKKSTDSRCSTPQKAGPEERLPLGGRASTSQGQARRPKQEHVERPQTSSFNGTRSSVGRGSTGDTAEAVRSTISLATVRVATAPVASAQHQDQCRASVGKGAARTSPGLKRPRGNRCDRIVAKQEHFERFIFRSRNGALKVDNQSLCQDLVSDGPEVLLYSTSAVVERAQRQLRAITALQSMLSLKPELMPAWTAARYVPSVIRCAESTASPRVLFQVLKFFQVAAATDEPWIRELINHGVFGKLTQWLCHTEDVLSARLRTKPQADDILARWDLADSHTADHLAMERFGCDEQTRKRLLLGVSTAKRVRKRVFDCVTALTQRIQRFGASTASAGSILQVFVRSGVLLCLLVALEKQQQDSGIEEFRRERDQVVHDVFRSCGPIHPKDLAALSAVAGKVYTARQATVSDRVMMVALGLNPGQSSAESTPPRNVLLFGDVMHHAGLSTAADVSKYVQKIQGSYSRIEKRELFRRKCKAEHEQFL